VTSYCPDSGRGAELALSSPVLRVFSTWTRLSPSRDSVWRGPFLHRAARPGRFRPGPDYTGEGLGGIAHPIGGEARRAFVWQRRSGVAQARAGCDSYPRGPLLSSTYGRTGNTALERLFIQAARLLPNQRFLIGGAQYPATFPWADNIYFARHVPPSEHPRFSVRAGSRSTSRARPWPTWDTALPAASLKPPRAGLRS